MSASQFPNETGESGEFERQEDAFRRWVRADPSTEFPAERDRYHLYVCYACPWAHRTIILRKLKGLEGVIGMTAVDPIRDEKGWRFGEGPGLGPDPVNDWSYLSEAYEASQPGHHARVTVPVLWDKKANQIVSNNEDDIMRMLNSEFDALIADPETRTVDFYPKPLRLEIDRLFPTIYERINDGVYKSGFATTQEAYEKNVFALFDALDQMETRLSRSRFLFGPQITELDWKLFVTLVRFDAVYHGHFKCNIRRIVDYPNLFGYLCDLYQHPLVAETVNFDHIKRHYYVTHDDINPTQITPVGPDQDLERVAHGRDRMKS